MTDDLTKYEVLARRIRTIDDYDSVSYAITKLVAMVRELRDCNQDYVNAIEGYSQRAEAAEAKCEQQAKALEIFSLSTNWRLSGVLDPNSPNFIGQEIARAALSTIRAVRGEKEDG